MTVNYLSRLGTGLILTFGVQLRRRIEPAVVGFGYVRRQRQRDSCHRLR